MQPMTKKARVDAAVRGQATDRPPVALWRHFYEREETAEGLADAMLSWHRTYDWDWMKINPRASYHVEGWGVRLKFSGQPLVKPVVLEVPVQNTRDWARLKPLSLESGPLAEQLEATERIRAGLGDDAYALATVFTPLSITAGLVKDDQTLLDHMRQDPQALHGALEVVTETFSSFVTAVLAAGADGIFFATTTWATYDTLTDDQHAEFARPYDLRVLAQAQNAPFNVLHVCKNNNMLLKLVDYPVHALNWAVGSPGNPTLAEVQQATEKCVVGGLKAETLREGTPAQIEVEAHAAAAETSVRRWMLGPACSVPVATPPENAAAARAVADTLG